MSSDADAAVLSADIRAILRIVKEKRRLKVNRSFRYRQGDEPRPCRPRRPPRANEIPDLRNAKRREGDLAPLFRSKIAFL
jgi:hypothetical protein